ncbi:two-component system, OmpR family, sensor kinase [Burkholderia sp. D7]|nr:two-component system, OmpR family, sensor kinase [Burkholderia sp. D7]
MVGFQGALSQSLRVRLSVWLAIAIVILAVLGACLSYSLALHEANQLQDSQLKQVASLITASNLPAMEIGSQQYIPDSEPRAKIVVKTLTAEQDPFSVPRSIPDGLHTISTGDERWRLLVRPLNSTTRIVVAQETADRTEIARNNALATLIPFAVLVPVLLAIVAFLMRRTFRPLIQLSAELDERSEHDISALGYPFKGNIPAEILPFVKAIDGLLLRVSESAALQRRFVADAAHELRSPLTALSLQAERLSASEMPQQARERLDTLRGGLARTRALQEQLLTLARVQDGGDQFSAKTSIRKVFRQVIEDLLPLAEQKGVDLGVEGDHDAFVSVGETDLVTLVKNLVDNAIRYTPTGGQVDLKVITDRGATEIQVDDTGPGIPESERERVFDRFYRVLGTDQSGSGLGLSIVQSIATKVGARIALATAGQTGLRVTVTF